ncbi:unnamed protein product [Brugia pahangi]|uniref:Uncharacterized protein n=1 Tax=Brugia pahangi TaxID=6280 RepID=A0A0N4U070_BRUPA|nr:unnamed protein product [Brugia pahangi]
MLFSSTTTANTTAITDSANIISSTIASQNDSRGKVISNGTSLAAINECIKSSADSSANSSISLLNSDRSIHESRQVRQVNTARVPPMIAQNSSANSSISLLNSDRSIHESRQVRQVNTARVPPMIAQNVGTTLLEYFCLLNFLEIPYEFPYSKLYTLNK